MRMSTLHKGKKSNRPAPLSLPIDLWPTADRSAWESACRTSDRLKRGGAASHLKSVTRNDLAYWYGYFLGFLSRNGLLTEDKSAPEYVSPENVDDYLMEIKHRVGIALLALCPIRLKNFVALEIGRTFVDVNDKWWIVLPATETKEGRADERPIDNILNPAIESYIATFRPILEARGSPRRLSGSREMTECR